MDFKLIEKRELENANKVLDNDKLEVIKIDTMNEPQMIVFSELGTSEIYTVELKNRCYYYDKALDNLIVGSIASYCRKIGLSDY